MKVKLPIQHLVKYIILITTLILVLIFFVLPNYNNLESIYLNLTKEAQTLESKYIAGEGLEKSSNDYNQISDQLPTYESLFIKRGEELLLVTNLENLADKYNLTQQLDLGLTKTEINKNIIQVPFNFILEGTFDNFILYLTSLYQMPFNLTIQNIDIKQTQDKKLEIHLLGYTYWLTNSN